jgi:flagellar protein FlgJ
MSLSVDGLSSYYLDSLTTTSSTAKADSLEQTLNNVNLDTSEDEELLEACKSFETYFIEQVFKEMKSTVNSSDDDGEYMQYFGDMLTEQYAQAVTDSEQVGLAQILYESMKRNTGSTT